MTPAQRDALFDRWLLIRDGGGGHDDLSTVRTALQADPLFAERCRDHLRSECQLARLYAGQDDSFIAATMLAAEPHLPRRRRILPLTAAAAAAAAAAALLLTVWWSPWSTDRANGEHTSPDAWPVQTAHHHERDVERIRPSAVTTVRASDGSRALVHPGAAWQALSSGLDLQRGVADCFIAARAPDRPYEVSTPHGRVRVLGTRFHVDARAHHSVVRLDAGRVQVTTGDDTAELAPGQVALMRTGAAPRILAFDQDDALAADDFRHGLPRIGPVDDRWVGRWLPAADGCLTPITDGSGGVVLRSAAGGWEHPPILRPSDGWLLHWRAERPGIVRVHLTLNGSDDSATPGASQSTTVLAPVGDNWQTTLIPVAALAPDLEGELTMHSWGLSADSDPGIQVRSSRWVAGVSVR